MKRLDEGDSQEEIAGGNGSGSSRSDGKLVEKIAAIKDKRNRHKALLDELDKTGEDQIPLTDPDARAMARMSKVGVGYNIELAVDVKDKLIAEQEVCNQVLDMGLLAPTVESDGHARRREDRGGGRQGYFKMEDIEACEKAGITAYVPKPIRGPALAQRFLIKDEFRYDPDKDIYLCPAGQVLSPRHFGKSRDNVNIDYVSRDACKACHLAERCTRRFRRVSHLENEAVLDRMAGASCRPARHSGPTARKRRTSVRHDQAMDVSGRVSDAQAGKRARGVQPDGARLQHQKSDHLVGVAGLNAAVRA